MATGASENWYTRSSQPIEWEQLEQTKRMTDSWGECKHISLGILIKQAV